MWISSDEVYHTDASDHTVTKFDTFGHGFMTLGTEGEPGPEGGTFRSPTRAVVSSSNDIFVSDGYQQKRCHRFTGDGELILSYGKSGSGPVEFNLPHNITIDRNDSAYVWDRKTTACMYSTATGYLLSGGLMYLAATIQ